MRFLIACEQLPKTCCNSLLGLHVLTVLYHFIQAQQEQQVAREKIETTKLMYEEALNREQVNYHKYNTNILLLE